MSDTKFDPRDFRSALGQFPTGVTVITTVDPDGQPIGCTASSFNTVSIDPALVLWSVDKNAFSAGIFAKAEYFAVNILSENQVSVSNKFAGRGNDKFKDVTYSQGMGQVPLLPDCGAQFQCKTWNVYEGGDHLIIVGEVVKYSHDDSLTPLVFSRGSYAITSQHPNLGKDERAEGDENEFLDNYLLYLLNSTISEYRKELYPLLIDSCDITPEKWRILTILNDSSTSNIEELTSLVMQPLNDLQEVLVLLQEKGIIDISGSNIKLTRSGASLQQKLFSIAKTHEAQMLAKLSKDDAEILKRGLKTIIGR